MTDLWRVTAMWRRRWAGLLGGVLLAWTAAGCAVALMSLSGALAAAVLGGAGGLAVSPWLLRGLGAGRFMLRYGERLATHSATFRALARLRVWLFHVLAERSAGGLGARRSGDVLARLVADVEALDGLYIRIVVPALVAAAALPALVALVWPVGPRTAILSGLLFATAAFALPLWAARAAARSGERLALAGADLRVAVVDTIGGLREVRAFGAEGRMLAAVQARESVLVRAQRDVGRTAALASAGGVLCAQAGLLLVLAARPAGWTYVAVLATVAVFELSAGLPRAGALLGHAAAAARRLMAMADAPVPVGPPVNPAPMPPGHAVRFEGVRFAWPGRPPLLDGLSLAIPAGARVAILGPSGAGKSTLAALLLKIASPEAGRITLGGTDIARLPAEGVRAQVAYLGQATHLFADTIRGNLLLGRPGATDADLWDALDRAAVADVVRALPEGLGTWLDEGGAGLSGGQSRRLALARTLLSAAPILLLDEPAAGLDAATERSFLETLNEAGASRTVVLIAHRLTGVERLDRIWRLSGGHAVAAAA